MAGLIWTAVTLSLLLYVGNCVEPPAGQDPNQLNELVNGIWNKYISSFRIRNDGSFPMFSLAVSIPYYNNNNDNDLQRYDINGVTDSADTLKATLSKCEVYKGERMVAATALKWPDVLHQCPNEPVQWNDFPNKWGSNTAMTWAQVKGVAKGFTRADHAEYRTLTAFNTLTKKGKLNKKDFMLFYVLSSPCVSKCTSTTDDMSILQKIKKIKKWKNYALVFTNVFIAGGQQSTPNVRKAALERLGESIGLDHIFRCDGSTCTSCSSGGQVNPNCYT